ncbi:MAG: hypothetical protein QM820_24895 [Minicystis sp.]
MLTLGACEWSKLGAGITGHKPCVTGQTVWLCTYKSTPCFMGNGVHVCASDDASARAASKNQAIQIVKPQDPSAIVIDNCTNTGATVVPQDFEPEHELQDTCSSWGLGGGAAACGNPGDLCGLDSELPCCSGVCSLSVCE